MIFSVPEKAFETELIIPDTRPYIMEAIDRNGSTVDYDPYLTLYKNADSELTPTDAKYFKDSVDQYKKSNYFQEGNKMAYFFWNSYDLDPPIEVYIDIKRAGVTVSNVACCYGGGEWEDVVWSLPGDNLCLTMRDIGAYAILTK